MDLLSVQSEEDSQRSRWLWASLILLLLLFLLGLAWFWWSGSGTTTHQAASHPLMKIAAASDVVMPPVAPPPELPATSYDVQFGYHQSTIKTNEAVSSAFEAWRSYNGRQCGGGACACEKSAKVDVVGHADRRTGTRDFNRCISWKRATAVADALTGLGVPRCDVSAAFVGDADTPSPESDEASAAKHRNATITIVAANAASPRCDGACKSSLSPSEVDHCEAKLKQRPLLHID